MGKRINLKMFRVGFDLTQEEFADRIGVERGTYTAIENGTRNGTHEFWNKLQTAFNVPDSNMWGLMRIATAEDVRNEA